MVKKVLSVVLALVLAVGVCAVAVSASTVDDLNAIVAKLPSDYNARFYNDETSAAIANAKEVAAAAIASGEQADIDNAVAVCQAAYDKAYEKADYELPPESGAEGDVWSYYVNRDENKATVDVGMTTDAAKYLQPGDTFTVTLSVKTNFYLATCYLGFAYDHTKLEVVDATPTDLMNTYYENLGFNAKYGRNSSTNAVRAGYFPSSWSDEMIDQYYLFVNLFSPNFDNSDDPRLLWFEESTEVLKVTMKVRDDATDGEVKLFMSPEFLDPYFPTDWPYEQPLIRFTRACGEYRDQVYQIGTAQRNGFRPVDEQAQHDKTITLANDLILNIGEAPALADYTALDAAIASINTFDSTLYTADSWDAFAKAVEAGQGCDRNLYADSQSVVDGFTKAIVDARDALVLLDQGSMIKSVSAVSAVRYKEYATLAVTAEGSPLKIRLTNSDGSTFTLPRDHANVLSITDNGDGTETWNIKVMVYDYTETYTFTARYADAGWVEPGYVYVLKAAEGDKIDLNVYSYEIDGAEDGRVLYGTHQVTVVTGVDVIKVQLIKDGNTWTYTADNATYQDVDGQRVWTFNHRFVNLGDGQVYGIRVRSATTAFELTNTAITVDVLA